MRRIDLGRLLSASLAVTAVFFLAGACGTSGDQGGDTHWLVTCSKDSDCGMGQCLCGVCTKPCSRQEACVEVGGACFQVRSPGIAAACDGLQLPESGGICLGACSRGVDCKSGSHCVAGACVPSRNKDGGAQSESGGASGAGGASNRDGSAAGGLDAGMGSSGADSSSGGSGGNDASSGGSGATDTAKDAGEDAGPDPGGPILTCETFELFPPALEGVATIGVSSYQAVDLDGDGDRDLVAQGTGAFFVWRNDGQRRLSAPSIYEGRVENISLGDLTGDGRPDVITQALSPNQLVVWNNDGDGTFTRNQEYSVASVGAFIGDIDVDGHADLLVEEPLVDGPIIINRSPAELKALRGSGDGRLAPWDANVPKMSLLAVEDLNDDGRIDLIGKSGGSVVSYLNTAAGYVLAYEYAAPAGQNDIAVAIDFDGNGKSDILTGSSREVLLTNDGSGSFTFGTTNLPSDFVSRVAIDVNSDGRTDLMDTNSGAGYLNLASGMIPLPPTLSAVTLIPDLDGDGWAEAVNEGSYYWSRGDGTFPGIARFGSVEVSGFVFTPENELAVADFNHDGHGDLIVSSYDGFPRVSVYLATDPNTFGAPIRTAYLGGPGPGLGTGLNLGTIPTADLDGDGAIDVVVANKGQLSYLHNTGAGEFTATSAIALPASPSLVLPEDVDDDGDVDLLVETSIDTANESHVYRLENDGAGAFAPRGALTIEGSVISTAYADFDRDGHGDLAVTVVNPTSGHQAVAIARGDGHGVFGPAASLALPGPLLRVAGADDFDGDGWPDLAVFQSNDLNQPPWKVTVWQSREDGSFALLSSSDLSSEPSGFLATDLDADGRPDFVVTSEHLSVFHNLGGGHFSRRDGAREWSVSPLDADWDGRLDLVSLNTYSFTALLNVPCGSP